MSFFCQAVRHLKQVKNIKSDDNDRTLTVKIEDVIVKVEPDSGAEVNVINEHQFKALKNHTRKKTYISIQQNELSVKREFTATTRNKA